MFRAVQNLFRAHLQDDVWVRADPRALERHVTQHRVQNCPGLAIMDRVNPHQNTIGAQ
jgi:hypothetical protein